VRAKSGTADRSNPASDIPAGNSRGGASHEDLVAARRVLTLESDSLNALADAIDGAFVAAVDLLYGATGRVIISGMGKSGHIGRKIAATLASTGTPSHFVHPGEASHGDLGMLQADDVAIVLSNSGSTSELKDLVAYTRFRGIPLLSMVGRAGSPLAEAADVALVLPQMPEACPMGLAPTTSTTMMLALGDALAVALMQRRGFSPDQFQVLHPGGRLGREFIKVEDIMHAGDDMPLVPSGSRMADAILVMTQSGFGCTGVVGDDGQLVGIVTDGDLRRHMGSDLLAQTVDDVMTKSPKTIRPKALAAEALGLMNSANSPFTALFATDEGVPKGFVHMHDILRAGIA
jgi:arabinose-5-phosphate isomerase